MAFDFKKEYKEFYMPKQKPQIVNVPKANYLAVRGVGDPNEEGGEYKASIGLLYTIAFTLKMSKRAGHEIDGFFDYVVPPLEGFWWQPDLKDYAGEQRQKHGKNGECGLDYSRKSDFHWISVIRLPDFIKKTDYNWAIEEATQKKKMDFSKVEFITMEEGLCVQIMHIGSYDDEPASVALMDAYLKKEGYENDFSDIEREDASWGKEASEEKWDKMNLTGMRFHHEIYLSDARKVEPARRKTVIRHPVKKQETGD